MVRFWKTQNMPTQRSATARFAKKKLVVDLSLLLSVTTRMTMRLPETRENWLKMQIEEHNIFI